MVDVTNLINSFIVIFVNQCTVFDFFFFQIYIYYFCIGSF